MPETRGSKGYLLPEIIDPGELQCIMVFIPKDDYYIRAFSGAFHRLGTWQVWEKDGTARAAEAALVWKNAIDYTMANGWIGECGMNEECCAAIIEAINNISIVVNVTGGGGCGCNVIDDYKFPDGWEDDTETYPEPPPLETTPPEVVGDEFCNMAHEAFQQMYEMIFGFVDSLSEFEPYYSIAEFLNTIAVASPRAGQIYDVVAKYLLAQYGKLVEDSQNYLLQLKDEIICIMMESASSEEATEAIKQLILDSHFIPFATREWLYALYSSLNLNALYDGTLGYREEFEDSICTSCLPHPPEGYLLIPILESEVVGYTSSGGVNAQTFDEDETEFAYDAAVGEWNANVVKLNTVAIKARAEVSSLLGCVMQIIYTNADDENYDNISNVFEFSHTFHLPGTTGIKMVRYNGYEYSTVPAYAAWIDQFDDASSYGNSNINETTELDAWMVGTHFVPKSVVYRVWMIGKL